MTGNTKLNGLPEDRAVIEQCRQNGKGWVLYDDGELDRMFNAIRRYAWADEASGGTGRSDFFTQLDLGPLLDHVNFRIDEYSVATHPHLWCRPEPIAQAADRLADAVERRDSLCDPFVVAYGSIEPIDDIDRPQIVRYFRGLAEHARKVAAAGVKLVTIDTAS